MPAQFHRKPFAYNVKPGDPRYRPGRRFPRPNKDWNKALCECHGPAQGHYFGPDLRCMNHTRGDTGLSCGNSWDTVQAYWSQGHKLPCPFPARGVESPPCPSPTETATIG